MATRLVTVFYTGEKVRDHRVLIDRFNPDFQKDRTDHVVGVDITDMLGKEFSYRGKVVVRQETYEKAKIREMPLGATEVKVYQDGKLIGTHKVKVNIHTVVVLRNLFNDIIGLRLVDAVGNKIDYDGEIAARWSEE